MFFTSLRTYQLLISDDISAATYDVGLCYFTIRSKYFHPLPRIINKCLLLFYYLSGSSSGSLSVHAHQNFNITQDYGKIGTWRKKKAGICLSGSKIISTLQKYEASNWPMLSIINTGQFTNSWSQNSVIQTLTEDTYWCNWGFYILRKTIIWIVFIL